jgi:hypothetical protein
MTTEPSTEDLIDILKILREIIMSLQKFIDSDDYKFIEDARSSCHKLMNNHRLSNYDLSGKNDLVRNVESMYEKIKSRKNGLDLLEHGLLVQQAVYTITRANIMAVGIEFKLKRSKG